MRLRFSESAVVAPYRGGRGLMFRVVNVQPGEVSDVQARVSVALYEEVNGRRERHFHQLELERKSVEFFPLHWTVVHPDHGHESAARPYTGKHARRAGGTAGDGQRARGDLLHARHGAHVLPVGRDALGREVRRHLRQHH